MTRFPQKTPHLRPVPGGVSYWAGFAIELIRTDKLCYVVALFTLAIVVLHSYGVDVLPWAHAARNEEMMSLQTFAPGTLPATFPPPP